MPLFEHRWNRAFRYAGWFHIQCGDYAAALAQPVMSQYSAEPALMHAPEGGR